MSYGIAAVNEPYHMGINYGATVHLTQVANGWQVVLPPRPMVKVQKSDIDDIFRRQARVAKDIFERDPLLEQLQHGEADVTGPEFKLIELKELKDQNIHVFTELNQALEFIKKQYS